MKEALQVAIEIDLKITEIDEGLELVGPAGKAKATADAVYDKALAITLIKLRNGVEMEIDGEKIQNPPTTIAEKIAKGIIYAEKLEKELSEVEYKRVVRKLDCVRAQLNGKQSINRHHRHTHGKHQ